MVDNSKDSSVTFSPETKEQGESASTAVAMEEGVEQSNTSSRRSFNSSSRLSFISKAYDIRHEGKLDETEQKMRAMDLEGRGYLSNQQVYDILQDQSRTQKALLTAKRLLIFFAVLLCVLAAANIGIAFAAARLAQNTSVDENDVLVVKGTDTSVATNSHADLYDITTTQQQVASDGTVGDVVTTMSKQDAENMYASCIVGGSVNLVRTWPDYRFNDVVSLCPADSYPKTGDIYTYAYASGNNVQVDCSVGGAKCTVSGSALLQQVDQDCVYNDDCATGNCFFDEWLTVYDPGTCKCFGELGCAEDETCVDNECRGPNSGNDNIIV